MADIIPNVVVSMPSQLFTLARSFKAAANGKIYIGKIDTDPTIPSNQIQVYLHNEDGSTVPVSQPILINAGGYPVYLGQISKFVTVEGHSMAIYDAYMIQQFYFPNVLKYDPDQFRQQLESQADGDGAALIAYNGKSVYDELSVATKKTNTVIDVRSGATRSGMYAQLVRAVGEGTNREIQDFAVSPGSNLIYSMHSAASGSNLTIITRYQMSGGLIKNQQDSMPGTSLIGHQGLTVERQEVGDKLWATYGVNPHIAMRFDYSAGGAPLNVELFRLFEDSRFSPDSSCNPSISPDLRFLTGFCLETGTQKVFCRVWDFNQILTQGAGDHSATWIYEWELGPTVYSPGTMPVQGHACSGNEIYFWSGGNGTASSITPRRLHAYTMDGKFIESNLSANVGRGAAVGDGSGVSYEPEGMHIVNSGGRPLLLLGVRSGSSLNPSVFRIWALGISSPMVTGDVVFSGNYQSSISPNDGDGRDYVAIRSRAEGAIFGAGVNYYGKNDSANPYSISEITGPNGSVRRSVSETGEHVFQSSAGVDTTTIDKPDSGNAIVLKRGGVAVGAVSINTAALSIFGRGVNIRFGNSDGTTDTNYWEVVSSSGVFRPAADNIYSLGQASLRPSVIFAGTGSINTSDETLKVRLDIIDAEREAAIEIKENIWKYKFTDAISRKGEEKARLHYGVGAQTVGAIMTKHGLDPTEYAFYCHDCWDDIIEPVMGKRMEQQIITSTDAQGGDYNFTANVEVEYDTGETKVIVSAGSRYGIRYEELICFIISAM